MRKTYKHCILSKLTDIQEFIKSYLILEKFLG